MYTNVLIHLQQYILDNVIFIVAWSSVPKVSTSVALYNDMQEWISSLRP